MRLGTLLRIVDFQSCTNFVMASVGDEVETWINLTVDKVNPLILKTNLIRNGSFPFLKNVVKTAASSRCLSLRNSGVL